MKQNESGRSMVEIVGVLAVMGLITMGAFTLVKAGMSSQKQSRAVDEIEVLAANARNMTAAGETTCSLPSIENLKDGGTLARAILKTNAESPVGGWYSLTRSTPSSMEECVLKIVDVGFVVNLVEVPEEDCVAMASRSYFGGTARCEGNILRIFYTKK